MFKIRFNKKIAFPPLAGSAIGVISNNSNLRFSVVRRRFFIFSNHKRGIVLFIVLGTLLVVASLATVILSLILSHARLTYHQTSRIQAYYAVLAGMNLARENLRNGTWITGTYSLCRSGCTVNDNDIPYRVDINIGIPNPTTGIRTIQLTSSYTYTP